RMAELRCASNSRISEPSLVVKGETSERFLTCIAAAFVLPVFARNVFETGNVKRIQNHYTTPLCGDYHGASGKENEIFVWNGIFISARCHHSEWAKLFHALADDFQVHGMKLSVWSPVARVTQITISLVSQSAARNSNSSCSPRRVRVRLLPGNSCRLLPARGHRSQT